MTLKVVKMIVVNVSDLYMFIIHYIYLYSTNANTFYKAFKMCLHMSSIRNKPPNTIVYRAKISGKKRKKPNCTIGKEFKADYQILDILEKLKIFRD